MFYLFVEAVFREYDISRSNDGYNIPSKSVILLPVQRVGVQLVSLSFMTIERMAYNDNNNRIIIIIIIVVAIRHENEYGNVELVCSC